MNRKKKFELEHFLKILPIIVLTSIVPLTMLVKAYKVPEDIVNVMGSMQVLDIYHYYKMIAIAFMGLFMTLILIHEFFLKKIDIKNLFKEKKVFIAASLLMILLILSTIFSPYKSVAFMGLPARFEGFYAFYTYILLLFYTPLILKKYKSSLYIVYVSMLISAVILSVIGLFEYYGYYMIEAGWFNKLAVFGEANNYGISLKYSLSPKTLASTLYNPNYMGSYIVMIITSAIALSTFKIKKFNLVKTIVSLLSILLFLVTLIYSGSSAGYFALVSSGLAFMILLILRLRNIKTFILTFIVISISLGGLYYEEFQLEKPGIIRSEYSKFKALADNPAPSGHVESLSVKNNILSLGYKGEVLNIIVNDSQIIFFDEEKNQIDYAFNKDNNTFTTIEEPFNEIQLLVDLERKMHILKTTRRPQLNLRIILSTNQIGYVDNYGQVITDSSLQEYPRWGFEGYEKFFNGRGYIWSLSIPLLKDNVILGSGSDTYALIVPQDDIIGKLNCFSDNNAFIDKPHSLFLQLGITQGILFTLIFIALVLYLLLKLAIDIIRHGDKVSIERIAIMCAVIGYMVAGIANDSTVGTAPVFWSLLSICILYCVDDMDILKS